MTAQERAARYVRAHMPAARPCCRRAAVRGYIAGWRARGAVRARAVAQLADVRQHLKDRLKGLSE